MENDFNGLRHTKCSKNYGMHILQRMYISVIISIDNNSCYLPAGGELALVICSATLRPPATDGSHPKNVELILRLVDFYAFIDSIMLDTASIKY